MMKKAWKTWSSSDIEGRCGDGGARSGERVFVVKEMSGRIVRMYRRYYGDGGGMKGGRLGEGWGKAVGESRSGYPQ